MRRTSQKNPLLEPVKKALEYKRNKKNGLIPRTWLLVILLILDRIDESDAALSEDEVYRYDYTLEKSRANAIPKLLAKHSLPLNLGMGKEGITTRGAPGLRMFREIGGGAIIMDRPKLERDSMVREAIELVRGEIMRVVSQGAIELAPHQFKQSGTFVAALLKAVENRSNGRVEQALVGAKLQLRFPEIPISNNPGFAGDRQTKRECDFEARGMRVIVSVSPKDQHFESAISLSDQGRQVYLVVAKKSLAAAIKRIEQRGYEDKVTVDSVQHYVTSNMKEIMTDQKISAEEMCLRLAKEYNQRILADNDASLQVVLPK